jgi:hypothetical protein
MMTTSASRRVVGDLQGERARVGAIIRARLQADDALRLRERSRSSPDRVVSSKEAGNLSEPLSLRPALPPRLVAVLSGSNPKTASAPESELVQGEFAFLDTPSIFTFSETAVRLRVPERTLRLLVSRHRPPVIKAGRRVLFDEFAINHLIESLRCPSNSPSVKAPKCSGLRGPSAANAFARALALTTVSSPKKSARLVKPVSTVQTSMAFDQPECLAKRR